MHRYEPCRAGGGFAVEAAGGRSDRLTAWGFGKLAGGRMLAGEMGVVEGDGGGFPPAGPWRGTTAAMLGQTGRSDGRRPGGRGEGARGDGPGELAGELGVVDVDGAGLRLVGPMA